MEEQLVQRLEKAVARLEAAVAGGPIRSPDADFPAAAASTDPAIAAFDNLISGPVARLLSAGEKIGGRVLDASKAVADAFSVEKELLVKTKQSPKPEMAGLQEFLKPLNEAIVKAIAMNEGKRSDQFNHLKAAADSLAALAWIAFLGKDQGMSLPIAHVEESWQMAEFYSNKILVEYRNKDGDHVEWAKALKELYIPGLRDYVKKYYPLGPVWGPAGVSISQSVSSLSTGKTPAPPPPPSAPLASLEKPSACPSSGMSDVFQEINSKPLTAGLRKVTDDMKTKNRTDKISFVSGSSSRSNEAEKLTRANSNKVGRPVFELQMGRKWTVENQIGEKNLVIDDCDSKQSVYVYGCKDSVLQIKGKVNNITLDKCTKTGLVFTDVVAACEIVNCNGVEVQCQGSAPTVSIDNTSGCQLYLSKESLEASITTAKASEINIMIKKNDTDGEWVQYPLPQQYLHGFKDGAFVTSPVSHTGA